MNLMVVNPLETHATSDVGKGFATAFENLGVTTTLFTPGELFEAKRNVFSLLESKFGVKLNADIRLLSLEGLIDEIILKDIDTLFVIRGVLLPIHHLEKLKKNLKNIKLVLYSTEDPYDYNVTKEIAPYYDIVISNDISGTQLYENGHFVPVGVDDTIFSYKEMKRHYDLSFIGTFFRERVELFQHDLDYIKSLVSYFAGTWVYSESNGQKTEYGDLYGHTIDCDFYRFLGYRAEEVTIPEKVNIIYNSTKIVPCPHRNKEWVRNTEREANNFSPRIFECALTKAFQLVSANRKEFIGKYFNEGGDIIYYDSNQDFIDKVKYYLEHEDERIRISENIYQKVINNHTYKHRAQQVLEIINRS